jgi:hypothetical protein
MSNPANKKKIEELMKQREGSKKNNEISQLEEEIELSEKTKEEKKNLITRLQSKITKMNDRKVITEMKQEDYKFLFDAFNIFILFLSAVLTVIEAIKNDVDVERANEPTKQFFKISPLFISTTIGFITAIVKFKRFQEKLEMNTKAIEKSIFTTYRMKKLQEDLHFADEVAYAKLLEIYKEEIFPLYNQAQGEIEGTLQHKDIIKYSQIKKKMENQGNMKLLKLENDEIVFSEQLRRRQEGNSIQTQRFFNRPPTPFFLEDQVNDKSLTQVSPDSPTSSLSSTRVSGV